jgi:hypothetical protein
LQTKQEGGKKGERVSNTWNYKRESITNWLSRNDFILQPMAVVDKAH